MVPARTRWRATPWPPPGSLAVTASQPRTGLGVDHGAVAEGYAVVCGTENVLAVKLDLPDKAQMVRKLEKRRLLRHARRARKLRDRKSVV